MATAMVVMEEEVATPLTTTPLTTTTPLVVTALTTQLMFLSLTGVVCDISAMTHTI